MAIDLINHSAIIGNTVAVIVRKRNAVKSGISNFFPRETITTNMVSTLVKKTKILCQLTL